MSIQPVDIALNPPKSMGMSTGRSSNPKKKLEFKNR
jgi:hypothetical protein